MSGPVDAKEAEALAVFKKAIEPQLDESLLGFMRTLNASLETACATEIDRCIDIVLLHKRQGTTSAVAVWNQAVEHIVTSLRDWKKESGRA